MNCLVSSVPNQDQKSQAPHLLLMLARRPWVNVVGVSKQSVRLVIEK
jgi:hypothetical protein